MKGSVWPSAKLGRFLAARTQSITPSNWASDLFELYSVPSFDTGQPEIVRGADIGSAKQHVAPGDVLICKINPRINRVWVVGDNGGHPQIGSTEWIRFPNHEEIVPHFLAYHLQRESVRAHLAMNASGVGGSLMRVKPTTLAGEEIPLPSVETQRRIVARIDELFSDLDDGEEELRRARWELETYRKSLLKAAVTGELTADWRAVNPPKESAADLLQRILVDRRARWKADPKNKGKQYKEPAGPEIAGLPELPASWVWASVDQLSLRVTKGSSPGWQGFEYQSEGILFVRSQNVGWGELRLADRAYLDPAFNEVERKAIVQLGDVLLNIVGASIGRACKADARLEGANTNQAVAGIRLVQPTLSDHIVSWLVSPAGQDAIFKNVVETARANLSLEDVRGISVPLPPLEELTHVQTKLADAESMRADMVDEVVDAAANSADLRQSILAAAFHGELIQ